MSQRLKQRSPIGYAEVPDFHVAVSRRADDSLAGRSILVGGDPQKGGKVLASSEDLQLLGIDAGMPLEEALDRAPAAVWVQTDMAQAREVSGLFRAAVRQEIEAVELDGLGGFYWEASSDPKENRDRAESVARRVREATDLPLRVGVAPIRFVARWAAEDAGGEGTRILEDSEFDAYLLRQPLERFPGVGPKTAARLAEFGANDVQSLRALGLERLEALLGNHGRSLWMLASGDDPKPLRARRHPTTLSREKSFSADLESVAELHESLDRLVESVGTALLREGLGAGRIALRLTFDDGRTLTRSQTLPSLATSTPPLVTTVGQLLERIDMAARTGIRKVGIVVAGLEVRGAEDRQLSLF